MDVEVWHKSPFRYLEEFSCDILIPFTGQNYAEHSGFTNLERNFWILILIVASVLFGV